MAMSASHELFKPKQMSFIFDPSPACTLPYPRTAEDSEVHYPNWRNGSSLSSQRRPQRKQLTKSISYHPLRLPPTVAKDGTISTGVEVTTVNVLPIRRRVSTDSAKPRTSAERAAEEDASWWTEEIRKRRETRRRWKEFEDGDNVVIGNKVDVNHPNYVTAYNMLTGLCVAVCFLSLKNY